MGARRRIHFLIQRPSPGGGRISFATEVKSELAGLTPARPCCQLSELRGIFYATHGRLIEYGGGHAVYFPVLRNQVARKVVRLTRLLRLDARYQAVRHPKLLSFSVELPLPGNIDAELFQHVGTYPGERCDRKAWLRGFFLGCGSVNAPSARYHLELVAPTHGSAEALAALLREDGIRAGVTDRAGRPLVYVKDGDGVVGALSMMGASRAVLEFENMRVVREVSAQVNRQLNFETANLDKAAGSASRQLAAIRRLEEAGSLEGLPAALRQTARMRLSHPELNLAELARVLRLSKSGINHRLRRLQEAAEKLEKPG
jgi:DNA-binding transcriptional regulator WhiA